MHGSFRSRSVERAYGRTGESVPLDGEVVEGRSAVDESVVTGEPIPVEKGPGDDAGGPIARGTSHVPAGEGAA